MTDVGSRVIYSPNGDFDYPQFRGKTGIVKYTSQRTNGLWYHVQFDFRPDMVLPCAIDELEEA